MNKFVLPKDLKPENRFIFKGETYRSLNGGASKAIYDEHRNSVKPLYVSKDGKFEILMVPTHEKLEVIIDEET